MRKLVLSLLASSAISTMAFSALVEGLNMLSRKAARRKTFGELGDPKR